MLLKNQIAVMAEETSRFMVATKETTEDMLGATETSR